MSEDFSELDEPRNTNRIQRWEGIGVGAIKADLEHSDGTRYVGRRAHHPLAWKWIRFKESQENNNTHVFPVPLRRSVISRVLGSFINNQWTVAIVGGIIVVVIGAIVLRAMSLD